MPTAAPIATHGAENPPALADAPPGVLLKDEDLDDPEQFHTIRRVPIIDAHDDEERGDVDEKLLRLIAKNSNALAEKGHYPALTLGHLRSKTTVVVVKGDHKIVRPGSDEIGQPPVVGYATAFHVAPFDGRPCLYSDFHIYNKDLEYSKTFPFRSIERISPPEGEDDPSANVVDRIALLRSPSQRNLGVLHYTQDENKIRRITYARSFPPLEDTVPSGKAPDEADSRAEDGKPAPPAEPDNNPNATPTPEDTMPQDDMTSDQAPPDDGAAAAPQMPATIGEMAPQDFFEAMAAANAEALRSVLSEHLEEPDADDGAPPPGEGDEGEEHTDYEASDLMDPDASEEDEMRSQYEGGGEAGGDDTFVPGGDGGETCDKKARTMYGKLSKDYGLLAKGQDEANELIVYLSDKLLEMEHKERRHNYAKQLDELTGSGWDINDECKAELLNDLGPDAPDGYESKKLGEIRKYYGRKAINRPTIPVAHAEVAPPEPTGLTLADRNRAIAYASKHGGTFTDALKATKV